MFLFSKIACFFLITNSICKKFFDNLSNENNKDNVIDIKSAQVLDIYLFIYMLVDMFGDNVTIDHIYPAGNIATNSPAGAGWHCHLF